jgi:hypothetical protein
MTIDRFLILGCRGPCCTDQACSLSRHEGFGSILSSLALTPKVGIAIRPATPVAGLIAVADVEAVDLLLVMTVEPGFGAQKFMADMMPKV